MNINDPEKNLSISSHPIKKILYSSKHSIVLLKYVFVFTIAFTGILSLRFALHSLIPPAVYKKDFIQEYLLAQAVFEGVDPYLPLPELAQRFLGPLPNTVFQHSTPHPPPVALLCLPLVLFSYEQAATAWFLFEMVCIVSTIYFILRWLDRRPGLVLLIFITLLVLSWRPFRDGLVVGQLMSLMLVLLVATWQALRSGNNVKGGSFLGCLIALKFIAWPVVIYLAIRKNWIAVITAGVVTVSANLGAALLMGFDRILYYYLKVSTIISPLYQAHEANFSMWTVGWRVFQGTGSPVLLGLEAPPLVASPAMAHFVSWALPLGLLGIGLTLALRAKSFDTSFGILVCVSILVNPIAWGHYLILALIPLVIVGHRLYSLDLPRKETWCLLLFSLLLFIPKLGIRWFILQLTGNELSAKSAQVPFAATLLTLIPAVAILGLLWLVWHIEHTYLKRAS